MAPTEPATTSCFLFEPTPQEVAALLLREPLESKTPPIRRKLTETSGCLQCFYFGGRTSAIMDPERVCVCVCVFATLRLAATEQICPAVNTVIKLNHRWSASTLRVWSEFQSQTQKTAELGVNKGALWHHEHRKITETQTICWAQRRRRKLWSLKPPARDQMKGNMVGFSSKRQI